MGSGLIRVRDLISKVKVDRAAGVGLHEVYRGESASIHLAVLNPMRRLKSHYHRERDEVYIIISGRGVVRVADEVREVGVGDVVVIPKETPHGIENIGKEKLVFLFMSTPPFAPKEDRTFIE